ncbi:MAG TPA: YcxB family protein [Dehalococcoidales bacterium]
MKEYNIEIETKLTKAAYIKLNYAILARRWRNCVYIVMFLLTLGVDLIASNIPYFSLGFLAFIVITYSILIIYAAYTSKHRNYFLPKKFVFSPVEVLIDTPIGSEKSNWDAFISYKKVAGFYLLYVSAANMVMIPDKDIKAQDIPAFESLLREKLGKVIAKKWPVWLKVLLSFEILLSLFWLFTIFMASNYGETVLIDLPPYIIIPMALLAPALLTTGFMMLVSRIKPANVKSKGIAIILTALIITAMIIILFDMYVFKSFMY